MLPEVEKTQRYAVRERSLQVPARLAVARPLFFHTIIVEVMTRSSDQIFSLWVTRSFTSLTVQASIFQDRNTCYIRLIKMPDYSFRGSPNPLLHCGLMMLDWNAGPSLEFSNAATLARSCSSTVNNTGIL